LRNYEKALEFYERSLELKNSANDRYDLDRLLINIGLCYNQLKDFKSANKFFSEGFSVCQQNCSKQILMEGKFGLGVASFGLQAFTDAIDHFNQSLEIAKQIGNYRFESENWVYLGKIFIATGEADAATDALLKAEALAIEYGYNELLI